MAPITNFQTITLQQTTLRVSRRPRLRHLHARGILYCILSTSTYLSMEVLRARSVYCSLLLMQLKYVRDHVHMILNCLPVSFYSESLLVQAIFQPQRNSENVLFLRDCLQYIDLVCLKPVQQDLLFETNAFYCAVSEGSERFRVPLPTISQGSANILLLTLLFGLVSTSDRACM